MKRALALLTTVLLSSNPGFAAPECGSVVDQAALRTAALQQELMVAALTCHDVNEYNQFVLGHQSELVSSDDALKAYFQRGNKLSGMATYNKYKTELANEASLQSSRDLDSFCGAAAREFDSVLRPASLAAIVAHVELMSSAPDSNCPVLADNRPERTIVAARAPREPYAPDEHDSAIAPSDSDRDWNSDDDAGDNDSYADDSDEPGDLVAPRPHPMLDEDTDH